LAEGEDDGLVESEGLPEGWLLTARI
jgi:hypothetical protein